MALGVVAPSPTSWDLGPHQYLSRYNREWNKSCRPEMPLQLCSVHTYERVLSELLRWSGSDTAAREVTWSDFAACGVTYSAPSVCFFVAVLQRSASDVRSTFCLVTWPASLWCVERFLCDFMCSEVTARPTQSSWWGPFHNCAQRYTEEKKKKIWLWKNATFMQTICYKCIPSNEQLHVHILLFQPRPHVLIKCSCA